MIDDDVLAARLQRMQDEREARGLPRQIQPGRLQRLIAAVLASAAEQKQDTAA